MTGADMVIATPQGTVGDYIAPGYFKPRQDRHNDLASVAIARETTNGETQFRFAFRRALDTGQSSQ